MFNYTTYDMLLLIVKSTMSQGRDPGNRRGHCHSPNVMVPYRKCFGVRTCTKLFLDSPISEYLFTGDRAYCGEVPTTTGHFA